MADTVEKIIMTPENRDNSINWLPLLAANNGFGGMNNPMWMMFMYPFILPFINNMFGGGMWGNGMFGGFGNNNGVGFLANQLNNDAGRDLILQALNGRADALGQLANITHTSVESVRDNIATMNLKLSEVGSQVGMSGLQVINAVQSGNAALSRQLCECCCENRLAISEQTNTLQSQAAANFAAQQLETCQQTNQLGSQADRNTATVMNRIADLDTKVTREFCEIREREMQSKIDTQGDMITQLRNQISNDKQTEQFNAAFNSLNNKITEIASKQPNTVPVQYPNITAVNNTPYMNPFWGWGNGWNGTNSFWN